MVQSRHNIVGNVLFCIFYLFVRRYILLPSYAMLGACMSPNFIARVSHVNASATSLALVCVDPEDPDETRRECLLRRLNRGIKLAEDIGLALGMMSIIQIKYILYKTFLYWSCDYTVYINTHKFKDK